MLSIYVVILLIGLCFFEKVLSCADPKPNSGSVVKFGNARFTILTEHLVRMEWDMHGNFNDDATFAFVNRNLPVPVYSVNQSSGSLTIATAALKVCNYCYVCLWPLLHGSKS